MKILITSGGTRVPIDGVRHVGNMSSGKFGADLAFECLRQGHQVFMFRDSHSYCPVKISVDMRKPVDAAKLTKDIEEYQKHIHGYQEIVFNNFDEYANKLPKYVSIVEPDIVVSAAAVSDYVVSNPQENKKISGKGDVQLTLLPVPKILPAIRAAWVDTFIVGFKLMMGTDFRSDEAKAAVEKVLVAGADVVAFNDLNDIRSGKREYRLFRPWDGSIIHIEAPEEMKNTTLAKQFLSSILGSKIQLSRHLDMQKLTMADAQQIKEAQK